ncbi:penicillin-binding protein 1A [Alkalibacillus flavidus]|uniref:Penicillin-binding protein 1A n=1 Tax=Alkalibacillus flavidus TaxID=546021 RepID=A0ABV2KRU5_9BACI
MSEDVKSRKANKQKKKQGKKINWKKVFITLFIIGFITLIVGAGVVYSYISDAPEISEEKLEVPASTSVLDREGNEIANLATENREVINYDDVSTVLEDAVIAAEDARFYEHNGIDLRRIGAAVIANVTDGFGSQGASTITQQVIENFLLSSEKQIKLKVQEQYLAMKLEQDYSKEQILMMYLNKIYYGNGIYGVQKASEVYFGKEDLHNLTLAEAAMLAGIPNRPNAFNPIDNPELAEERRNTVLNLMVHHDKITEQEAEEAKQVKVSNMVQANYETDLQYPSFVETVYSEAESLIDNDNLNIYTAGLTIHTTLDQDAQKQVEHLLGSDSPVNFPENQDAGIVALDTQTGQVLAIGGGRNKEGFRTHNNATDIGRGPGSSIKPIVSYGPVIDQKQFSTYHQYNDSQSEAYYSWTESGQAFENYGRYHGWVTMRQALYDSLNVPAVINVRENLNKEQAGEFARSLGISSIEGAVTESMPLGGVNDVQTNPYEMAGAYAAFGNEGMYNEPHTITKIEFPDGRTVEPDRESVPVMEDYTAYMISDMLKDVVNQGTASSLNLGNLPVAAKTGTTNKDVDGWITGYTTNFSVSVWTGYENNDPNADTGVRFPLFENMMQHLSEGVETSDFVQPDSVVEREVEKGTRPAKLPSDYTPESEIITELFVESNLPTETSDEYERIDPVESLDLIFNEENESIDATWSHPSDDDSIRFSLTVTSSGEEVVSEQDYADLAYVYNDIEPGQSYTFEVTAYNPENEDNESEPTSATIEIPGEDSDFWEDFFGDDSDNDGSEDDNQNDSNNDNDDNNNDNNDNSNNNDDGTTDDEQSNTDQDNTSDDSNQQDSTDDQSSDSSTNTDQSDDSTETDDQQNNN